MADNGVRLAFGYKNPHVDLHLTYKRNHRQETVIRVFAEAKGGPVSPEHLKVFIFGLKEWVDAVVSDLEGK